MMTICAVCAVGAGIAMPLMFLVFGKLVGDFTGYFAQPSVMARSIPQNSTLVYATTMLLSTRDTKQPITKEAFLHAIDKSTCVTIFLDCPAFCVLPMVTTC
jgi:hypothetical protein